jgi:phosphoribosylamine--glycine ligase
MPLVRDYKRAYDGDRGPNTGSMGSYSCPDHGLPGLPRAAVEKGARIMRETVEALTAGVGDYMGVLYGGFMHTGGDVYLIEYNSRFGDPEAMNVLSLLRTPLTEVALGIMGSKVPKPIFDAKATVCVYLTPEGYPDNPLKDQPVKIGRLAHSEAYYASVYDEGGVTKTTSSRAVALLSKGATVEEARRNVYRDVAEVRGRLHYRKDIAEGV